LVAPFHPQRKDKNRLKTLDQALDAIVPLGALRSRRRFIGALHQDRDEMLDKHTDLIVVETLGRERRDLLHENPLINGGGGCGRHCGC
jgi:hypothetical protein